jgi:hypothetical protein
LNHRTLNPPYRIYLLPLLLVMLLIAPLSAAADEGAPPLPPALIDQFDRLEATVIEMRGLEALAPVTRRFPTRDEVIDYLYESVQQELTDEVIFEATQFYRAFDLVAHDVDVLAAYLRLLGDQVGGFYDPETKEMNVLLMTEDELGETLPPMEQIIYAHEYTHVLQDQHFGLEQYLGDTDNADRSMALLSLIEGDAMFIMEGYMTQLLADEPGAILQVLAISLASQAAIPPDTPPILVTELLTPYSAGQTFVTALYNHGGWDAVNAAYENPPETMTEIFNPDLYLAGFESVAITIEQVDDLIAEGWSLLFDRTLGEFYLRQYLGMQLPSRAANRAASGWRGDRYHLYHHEEQDLRAWVLRLAWDGPDNAAEFAEVFETFALARFGEDVGIYEYEGGTVCWHDEPASQDVLCLLHVDGESLIAFAPVRDMASALIEAQLRIAVR